MDNFVWDKDRHSRTGIAEAIFCTNKSAEDLLAIVQYNIDSHASVILTRLSDSQWQSFPQLIRQHMDYEKKSQTAILNPTTDTLKKGNICIVTAGTSDLAVAAETRRVLTFNGYEAPVFADVGVAGLWRLMERIEQIREFKIVIAVAGMEAALFSVLAGLVRAPVIAVPTSVGYGVSAGGKTALGSALASCAPGILTVNIDNGFGAAAAAVKIVNQFADCSVKVDQDIKGVDDGKTG